MSDAHLGPGQAMLRDTARRYLAARHDFSRRSALVAAPAASDPALWRDFAAMGWLGLPFPEGLGGVGGSAADLALLLAEFGRALVVEPYLSTVILGGTALAVSGDAAHAADLLPRLVAGDLHLALAFAEPQAGYDPFDIATTLARDGEGWRLDGRKAVVLGAPSADLLIVSARTAGGQRDRDGIALALVEPGSPGVALRGYRTIDGRRAAEVGFDGVRLPAESLLGPPGGGADALERAVLAGSFAAAAEIVGAMAGAIDATAAYLNTREQFGQKLAEYQALRHRLADMFVLKEETAALVGLAAAALDGAPGPSALEAVAAAKAYAGQNGRRVAEEAVQMHGAIAIADETMVGHCLKRVIANDRLFGGVDHHLDIFMRVAETFT